MSKKTPFPRLLTVAVVLAVIAPGIVSGGEPNPPSRLSADFVMTRTLVVLSDTITSSGKLTLGGPGLLRWEMTSPSRSVLVVNKGTAWIHYPDMGVTKGFDLSKDPVMKVLSEHLLVLTAGQFDRMEKFYDVSDLPNGVKRLVPFEPAVKNVFSEIRVKMGAAGVVSWVEMVSGSGDLTRIAFENVKLNPTPAPNLFEKPANVS